MENDMDHFENNAFPFNHQMTHSSNEGLPNTSNVSTDWSNPKREAEFAVDLLNPSNKKYHVDPIFAPTIGEEGACAPTTMHQDDESLNESAYFGATEAFVDDSADIQSQEDQFHNEWKNTCDSIMKNPESCPHRKHLVVFSSGIEERRVVQASLEKIFQETHGSLNRILEESLACAVPVHEKICDKMSDLEGDVLALFHGNHDRRRNLLQSLDAFNDSWQKKYSDFTSRVILDSNLCIEHTTDAVSNVDAPLEITGNVMRESKGDATIVPKEGQDSLHAEPDWESMVELNPSSHSNIETFLDGVRNWNAACDDFLGCFDEIRQAIEVSHSNMLEILESAYVRLGDDLNCVQIDIQEHIISNTHRREQIEQALQQVVQQQQTMFSRLMSRVAGKAHTNHKEPAAGTSKGTCLRAMIPFASMFSQNN